MIKSTILALCASAAIGGSAFAQTSTTTTTVNHVDALLVQWDAAAKQASTMTPAQQRAFGEKIAVCAEKCPVGCRMGETLTAVNAALAFSVASCAANEQHCPLNNTEDRSTSYATGQKLKDARTAKLTKLHKLASYTAAATTGDESCKAACAATIASGEAQACCPIRLASEIGTLKASFVDAQAELAELSAAEQGEIFAGFASLSETNKAVALIPESVFALKQGLEELKAIDAKMGTWAQSHPELMQSVPESAMQAHMMQAALLDETRELLTSMTETMTTMQTTVQTASASGR